MTKPVRLRLSRRAGFDLQAHSRQVNGLEAVNVARPGVWGNPFIVGKDGDRAYCVDLYKALLAGMIPLGKSVRHGELLAARLRVIAGIDRLRGKNLACWCALDGKPCHAEVLLDIANRPICEEVES
ncbi:DUF4326 domain-containing protein [Allomesorhizobium alhagi]|uniref:DUF4326 domain-containing protein n=1 Tax=Mesorhizobium alhagi CCNWXJ12-2 TaxID=1107882 RepID=H0HR07_9HYPH|nr:DUF4326 domain-containing protein [Mesorhizobium alhagi]EHK56869.1 hypothetical protein MAXJ12_12947 [Mesorhizobium alhagi CCNWXJ12-2]